MLRHTKCFFLSLIKGFFYDMRCFVMFVTAACILFHGLGQEGDFNSFFLFFQIFLISILLQN